MSVTNLSRASIEKLARNLRSHVDISYTDDIKTILSRLDGVIRYDDILNFVSDETPLIQIFDDGTFIVSLPAHQLPARHRFDAGVALGIRVLHFSWNRYKGVSEPLKRFAFYDISLVRREAIWFASELLMPELEFREKAAEFSCDVTKLANEFALSRFSVQIRLQYLGLAPLPAHKPPSGTEMQTYG